MANRNLSNGAAIPMDPGEWDRAVTLQQLTESTATSNFPKEDWTTLAPVVFMRKLDARGDERVRSNQTAAHYETQWEMGYRDDMDPEIVDVAKKRRIIYQSRVHEIVMASVIGRREGIELLTIAGSGGAL